MRQLSKQVQINLLLPGGPASPSACGPMQAVSLLPGSDGPSRVCGRVCVIIVRIEWVPVTCRWAAVCTCHQPIACMVSFSCHTAPHLVATLPLARRYTYKPQLFGCLVQRHRRTELFSCSSNGARRKIAPHVSQATGENEFSRISLDRFSTL